MKLINVDTSSTKSRDRPKKKPTKRTKKVTQEYYKELRHSFEDGDLVKLDEEFKHLNKSLDPKKEYTIKTVRIVPLVNMSAWIIYLEREKGVQNPYLAHYFQPVNS